MRFTFNSLFTIEIYRQNQPDVTELCHVTSKKEERKEQLASGGKIRRPPASSVPAGEFSISVWIRLSGA